MNKDDILANLNDDIVARFRTAIELGKWPDGRKLTQAQQQTCLQAVMVWEHEHLPVEERVGFIHKPKKDSQCDIEHDKHYPNLPNPKQSDFQAQNNLTHEKPIKFKH